jgi:hypothetical protein
MLSKHSLTSYKCYPKRLIYKKKICPVCQALTAVRAEQTAMMQKMARISRINACPRRLVLKVDITALQLLYYCFATALLTLCGANLSDQRMPPPPGFEGIYIILNI